MRKYFIILALFFFTSSAQSQVLISLLFGDKLNSEGLEFGLEGGFNWSSVSSLEAGDRLSTFNLGFYFDIRLTDPWYLYTGVLVRSRLGVDGLSPNDLAFLQADVYPEQGEYSQVMNYFLVPALAKYKFENRIYVEGGLQFGLMYDAWVEFNSDVDGKKAVIREYNDEKINWLDAGVMAGLGYSLLEKGGMTFGIKYYYGFLDVYKDKSGTYNSSIFLKMSIPIGADD